MGKHRGWATRLSVAVILGGCVFAGQVRGQQAVSADGATTQSDTAHGATMQVATTPVATTQSAITQVAAAQVVTAQSVSGSVADQSGSVVAGARVKLTSADGAAQEVFTGEDGRFRFERVTPGFFQLVVTADGFAKQISSGNLHEGETLAMPQIALTIMTAATEVRVTPSLSEEAHDEMKIEEKQRVLGVVPNFYISYIPNAAPLSTGEKFELAWKTSIDPISFGIVGVVAGVEQASGTFGGYGQGAAGYGRRYGAAYGDFVIGTFIGGAILPSVLKQDPRYFYKGTGSTRSRVMYALANAVIRKGDNGKWQPDYSGLIGGLAAAGISNAYYPAADRNGAGLTFENALIGIGANAAGNLLQEFLFKKLTPGSSGGAAKSQGGSGSANASR